MLSLEGEVTKVSEIENKNGYIYRNIEVYYGNAENPKFTMNKPLCYECDLKVGDQVRIEFELRTPKGITNLYITRYRKLNNSLYDCTPKTVNQPDDTEDLRLDDESERALDMIFDSPQGKEASIKEAQRQAAIAMVSLMQPKRQTPNETEENKQVPDETLSQTVHKDQIGDNNAVGKKDNNSAKHEPDNAFANNECQYGECGVPISPWTQWGAQAVSSKKDNEDNKSSDLVQEYKNNPLAELNSREK